MYSTVLYEGRNWLVLSAHDMLVTHRLQLRHSNITLGSSNGTPQTLYCWTGARRHSDKYKVYGVPLLLVSYLLE